MKLLISTFFFLISLACHSNIYEYNSNIYEYNSIDKKVASYPTFRDAKTLTIRISNDFKTDIEKARAIFTWIALNVKYNDDYNSIYINKTHNIYFSEYQKNRARQKKEADIIKYVFNSKEANCYGYSILYKTLCNKLHIESQIIYGLTKSSINDIGIDRVIKDHAWNSVKINNKWELIDVTWSAGYQDMLTKKFIKSFNDFYFLTSPKELINDHFPAKKQWQLIENTINLEEFFATPILYSAYFNSNLKIAKQHSGILYITKNTKTITLHFDTIPQKTNLHALMDNDFRAKKIVVKKNKISGYLVTLKVKNKNAKSLTIFNNGEAVIGFKIETQNNNL
ncbi:transglutaminase domain-containing protein [Lacinutrix himadriensis]|uniref:transglutaminase domain-containing protein n=1 Tax=Lacinutrix himadriensis TaxID=641549 RepID=UPI0006E426BF|nr:transglutaminase domain-containing protein [Lacinutrix himadriensis]